jgi:hypothetical protein
VTRGSTYSTDELPVEILELETARLGWGVEMGILLWSPEREHDSEPG